MDELATLISDPVFDALCRCLAGSDLALRKGLLTLSRFGKLPETHGNLFHIVEDATTDWLRNIESILRYPRTNPYPSILYRTEVHELLNTYLANPLYQGAAIMAIFIYTPSDEEIEKIKLQSYLKEINVMDGPRQPCKINFNPLFGSYNESIHPDVEPNPKMAKRVHTAIDDWIKHIKRYAHTPRMSKKLLNTADRAAIEEYLDYIFHEPQFATQADLEMLEFAQQVQLDNPVELKQRWYTNGLSPRSYYVCGSGLYYDVRYTQRMWNDLVNSLAATHKRGRVNPGRIYIENLKHALFYDLTSFTSNMATQPVFLERLALYCEGNEVEILTTEHGTITISLARLIRHYNNSNNFPPYVCPALATMMSPKEDTQCVAGFLGVYGNIATCMFLHGAVLLQLAQKEDECGVAGDDAVIVVAYGEEDTVWCVVALLGILAREKTFDSDQDVLYLKRRTELGTEHRLLTHNYVQLPSFLSFLPKYQLKRFREFRYNRGELHTLAISSLNAFFQSASRVDPEFYPRIIEFAAGYYRLLNLPLNGHVPQFDLRPTPRYSGKFIPCVDFAGNEDFVSNTIEACYNGVARVPVRDELEEESEIKLEKGLIIRAYSQPSITYLTRLGFLERVSARHETLFGAVGLSRALADYRNDRNLDPKQYIFRCIRPVPSTLRGGEITVYGEIDFDFGTLDNLVCV